MKVQADVINGVYQVEEFEDWAIIVNGNELIEKLKTCKEEEVLASILTEDQVTQVEEEYGVSK